MIAIPANEVSHHHHMGSFFNDLVDSERELKTVSETLEAIAEKNGLGILYHPGSYNGTHGSRPYYPIDWYVDMFQRYDHLVGMEAYSDYHYIEWISNGKSIHYGDRIHLHDFPGVDTYVRANIYQSQYADEQSQAVTMTQPFGIRR